LYTLVYTNVGLSSLSTDFIGEVFWLKQRRFS